MLSSASHMSKGQVGLHYGSHSPSRSVKVSSPRKPSLWKRVVIQYPKPLPKSQHSEAHKKSDVPKYNTAVVQVGNLVLISAHKADLGAAKEDDGRKKLKSMKNSLNLLQKDGIDRKAKRLLKSKCRFEVIHCYSPPGRKILQESHQKSFCDTKWAVLREESQQKSQDTNFYNQGVEDGHSRRRLLKKGREVSDRDRRSKVAIMGQQSAILVEDKERTGRLGWTHQRTLSGERTLRPPLEGKPATTASRRRCSSIVRRDSWVSVDGGNTPVTKKVNLGNILLEPYRNRQKPRVSMKEQQPRTGNELGVFNGIENVRGEEFTFDRKTAQIFGITKNSATILEDNNIQICGNEKEIELTGESAKSGVSKLLRRQVLTPTNRKFETKINDKEIEPIRRNRRQSRMIEESGSEIPGESKMESRDFGIILEKLYKPKDWKISAKDGSSFKAQNKRYSDHYGDLNDIKKLKKDPFLARDAIPGLKEPKNEARDTTGKAVQEPDKLKAKYFTHEPLQNTAYINSQIVKGSKVLGLLSEISREFEEMAKDLSKPALQRHKETSETYAISNRALWNAEAMSGTGKHGGLEKSIQNTREVSDSKKRSATSDRTSHETKVSVTKWGTAKESDKSASETKFTTEPPMRPWRSDRSSTRAELKKVSDKSCTAPITVKEKVSRKHLNPEDENLRATQTFDITFAKEDVTVYNEKTQKKGANFTAKKINFGESKDDSLMLKELLGDARQLVQLKKIQHFSKDKQIEIEGETDYNAMEMENSDKGLNELGLFSSKVKHPNLKYNTLPVVPVMVNGLTHVRDGPKDEKKPSTEEKVSKVGGDGNTGLKLENDNIPQRTIDFRHMERWNNQKRLRQSGIENVWWEEAEPQKVLADESKQFIKPIKLTGMILEGIGETKGKQENNKRRSGQSKSKEIFSSSVSHDSDEQRTDMRTIQTSATLFNPEKYDANVMADTKQEDTHGAVLKKVILEPVQERNINAHRTCQCQTNDNTMGSLRTNGHTVSSLRTNCNSVGSLLKLLKTMMYSVGSEVRTTETGLLSLAEPTIPDMKEEATEQKRKREQKSCRGKQKYNEKSNDVPDRHQKVSLTDKSKKSVDKTAKGGGCLATVQKVPDGTEKHVSQQKAAVPSEYIEALRGLYDEKDMHDSKRLQMLQKHSVRREDKELDKHGMDAKMKEILTDVEPKKDGVGRDIDKTKGVKEEKSRISVSKKTKEASTQTISDVISAGVKGGRDGEKKESVIPAVEKSKESVKHESLGKMDVTDSIKPRGARSIWVQCEIIPYRNGPPKPDVDGIIESGEEYHKAQESLNETGAAWRATQKSGEAQGEYLGKGQAQQGKDLKAEKSFKLSLRKEYQFAESVRTESHSKLKACGTRKKGSPTKSHAMERATDVESDDLKWSRDFDELASDLSAGSSYEDSVSGKDVIKGAMYSSRFTGQRLHVVGVPTKYSRAGEHEDDSQQDKIPLLDEDSPVDIVRSSIDNLLKLKTTLNRESTSSIQPQLRLSQDGAAHDNDTASRSSRKRERMSYRASLDHKESGTAESSKKHMIDMLPDGRPESEREKKSTHRLRKEKEVTQSRQKTDYAEDEKLRGKGIKEFEKSSDRGEREDLHPEKDREPERDWFEKRDMVRDGQLSGVEISSPGDGHETDSGSKNIHSVADNESIRDEQAEQIKLIDDDGRGRQANEDGKRKSMDKDGKISMDEAGRRIAVDKNGKISDEDGRRISMDKDGKVSVDEDGRRKSLDKDEKISVDEAGRRKLFDEGGRKVIDDDGKGRPADEDDRRKSIDKDGKMSMDEDDRRKSIDKDGKMSMDEDDRRKSIDKGGKMSMDEAGRRKLFDEDGRKLADDDGRGRPVEKDGKKFIDADSRSLLDEDGRRKLLDEGKGKFMDEYGRRKLIDEGSRRLVDEDGREKSTDEGDRRRPADDIDRQFIDSGGGRKLVGEHGRRRLVKEDGERKLVVVDGERRAVAEDGRLLIDSEDSRNLVAEDGRKRSADEGGRRKPADEDGKRKPVDEDGRRRLVDLFEERKSRLVDEDGRRSVDEDGRRSVDEDGRRSVDEDGRSRLVNEDGKRKSVDEDGKRRSADEFEDGRRGLVDEDGRRRSVDECGRRELVDDGRRRSVDEFKDGRRGLIDEDGRKSVDECGRKLVEDGRRRSVDECGRRELVDDGRRSVDEFKDGRRGLVDDDGRRSVDECGRRELVEDGRRRSVDEFKDGRRGLIDEDGRKRSVDECGRRELVEDGRRRSVDEFKDGRRGLVDKGRRRAVDERRREFVDEDGRRRSVDEFEDGRRMVDEDGRRRSVDECGRRELVDDGRRRSVDEFKDGRRGLVDEDGRRRSVDKGGRRKLVDEDRKRSVDENGRIKFEDEDVRRLSADEVGRKKLGDNDGGRRLVSEDGRCMDEDGRSGSADKDDRGGLMDEDRRRKLTDDYGRPQFDLVGRQVIDSDGRRRSSDKDGKRLFDGISPRLSKLSDIDSRKILADEYGRILSDADGGRRCIDEDSGRQSMFEDDGREIIHDARGFPGRFTKPLKQRSFEELEQRLGSSQDLRDGVKHGHFLRSRSSSGEKKIKFYKFGPMAGGNYKKKQFAQPVCTERKGPWIRFYHLCKPTSMNNLCSWTLHASPTSSKKVSNDYDVNYCTLSIYRDES